MFRKIKNFVKFIKSGGVVNVFVNQLSPSEKLKGKKVLITGGGSGFGFQMAKDFIAEGAEVVITGRNADKLTKAKMQIGSERLHTILWDHSNVTLIESHLPKVISMLGGLDVAINNAGVWRPTDWHTVMEAEYDTIVDTNSKGLYFLCKAEAEFYIKNHIMGKIINITSIEGIRSGFIPYSISKWGANCLTQGLAKELARYGVQVNAIAPGVALTDINMGLKESAQDNYYFPAHRTGRFTMMEEISNVAMFLSSNQANNIIGQIIAIDGGWTLQ